MDVTTPPTHPRDLQRRSKSRKPEEEEKSEVAACNSSSFSRSLRSMAGMDNNLRRDAGIASHSSPVWPALLFPLSAHNQNSATTGQLGKDDHQRAGGNIWRSPLSLRASFRLILEDRRPSVESGENQSVRLNYARRCELNMTLPQKECISECACACWRRAVVHCNGLMYVPMLEGI